MPLDFLQAFTAVPRTRRSNRQLGCMLAWVAGAVNAGGFLAVQRYTSHMSGILSAMADDLVLGQMSWVLGGLSLLMTFLAGAATTAVLINWARRRGLHGVYALPLALEAGLLLIFGLLGGHLELLIDVFVPSTVILLCFVMGLQNALVTEISAAEIRTTHMTGVVTDIGIELGRLIYWNRSREVNADLFVCANRDKLASLLILLTLFFGGGVVGAFAFKHAGFVATVPIAGLLAVVAAPPLLRDLWAQRALIRARWL